MNETENEVREDEAVKYYQYNETIRIIVTSHDGSEKNRKDRMLKLLDWSDFDGEGKLLDNKISIFESRASKLPDVFRTNLEEDFKESFDKDEWIMIRFFEKTTLEDAYVPVTLTDETLKDAFIKND